MSKSNLITFDVVDDFVRATVINKENTPESLITTITEYNIFLKTLFENNPSVKYRILLDVRNTQAENLEIPPKVTELTDEITNMKNVDKAAVLGLIEYQNEVIELMFSRVREGKANYFIDEIRALRWLGKSQ